MLGGKPCPSVWGSQYHPELHALPVASLWCCHRRKGGLQAGPSHVPTGFVKRAAEALDTKTPPVGACSVMRCLSAAIIMFKGFRAHPAHFKCGQMSVTQLLSELVGIRSPDPWCTLMHNTHKRAERWAWGRQPGGTMHLGGTRSMKRRPQLSPARLCPGGATLSALLPSSLSETKGGICVWKLLIYKCGGKSIQYL